MEVAFDTGRLLLTKRCAGRGVFPFVDERRYWMEAWRVSGVV